MSTATGYDFKAETERLHFPDITLRGMTLNRGSARVELTGPMERPEMEEIRKSHAAAVFPNTLDPHSPVLELGWPVAGPYVGCPSGVYMDLYLGVAQKLIDENHPALHRVAGALERHGLLFRREINTDDYLRVADGLEGVTGPAELAALLNGLAASRWPGAGGYKTFFSNSGAEAVEAALKLCWVVKYKKFVELHGMDVLRRVQKELGATEVGYFSNDAHAPVFSDYPFVVVAMEGSFHGRTLGALHGTRSKGAHHLGYPKSGGVQHIAFNAAAEDVAAKIDPRPIAEVLDAPGGVRAVLQQGRIPADLFAGILSEPFQGEGGYIPAARAFFAACEEVCRKHDALLVSDEVQTFGRTGTLFMTEQLGVTPDAVVLAKGAVVGATLGRADLTRYLHNGWHSNTFGGGKIFDVNFAHAVVDVVANERNPVFDGLSYAENCAVKGEYLQAALDRIAERRPGMLTGHEGRGLMHGVNVRRREEVLQEGWRRGLKLIGCGPGGEHARVRLLFLADTLAREIDDFARVFEETLAAVEST